MAENRYRGHFLALIMTLICLLLLAAVPNIYYDPLCCFQFFPSSDRPVPVVDSRLQKTNHLLHGPKDYSAVLLGSSRVEQLKQQDFQPQKVFNYAAPSFYPDEAIDYLDFFLKQNRGSLKRVYLGLDFYGSNSRQHEHAKPPRYYFDTSNAPLYAFKTALSRDAFNYSLKMAKGKREMFMYDPITVNKLTLQQGKAETDKLRTRQYEVYRKTFYGDFKYDAGYPETLRRLKNSHPDLDIVVFTTPVSRELFKLMIESGRLADYERWLGDIVTVFGRVHHFMVLDQLSANRDNFMDAHHLYPDRSSPISRIISGNPAPEDRGVGVLLTKQNMPAVIAEIRKAAEILKREEAK